MPSITADSYVSTPHEDVNISLKERKYCLALLFLSIHLESKLSTRLMEHIGPTIRVGSNDFDVFDLTLGQLIKAHSKCPPDERYPTHSEYVHIDRRYITLLKTIKKIRNEKVAHKIYWWYETEKDNPPNDAKELIKNIINVCKRGLRLYDKLG